MESEKNYLVLNIKNTILLLFLALSLFVSLIMKVFHTSSMALGTFFIIFIIFLLFIIKPLKISYSNFFTMSIVCGLFLVFALSMISSMNFEAFSYIRFFIAYFLFLFFIFLASILAKYFIQINNNGFYKICNIIFYILLIDGIYSAIKYILLRSSQSTLLFSEPSHFALVFLPFFLFQITVKKLNNKSYIFIFLFALFIAFGINNLTLLVGILLCYMLFFTIKHSSILLALGLSFTIFIPDFSLEYFISRLQITGEVSNLSTLVFLSGWERALYNLEDSFGLGIGFNQLGYVGRTGKFQEILSIYGMSNLNIFDGGTTASKVISEMGLLGLSLVALYLGYMLKVVLLMKTKLDFFDTKDIFFMSVFITFFIELFIRGVGYFSATSFLFFTSICYLQSHTFKKLKKDISVFKV